MTPERAKEIGDKICHQTYVGFLTAEHIAPAILAACAEERREALTEAAEAIREEARKCYIMHRKEDYVAAIERLRDQPEKV